MKLKTKQFAVRMLAVAMASTLAAGVGSAFLKKSNGSVASAALTSGFENVTGKIDTSALRAQYLKKEYLNTNKFSPDEKRWVIVDFGQESVMDRYLDTNVHGEYSDYVQTAAAKRQAEAIENTHTAFLKSLSRAGISYELKYSYTSLLSGVAIRVRLGDVASIYEMSGVKDVYFSESYATPTVAVTNNANVYSTGIYDSSDLIGEVQGEGMAVAVLDTGIDFSHNAFQSMPDSATMKYDRSKIEDLFNNSNPSLELKAKSPSTTVDEIYYNDKVPFAFDYADDDPDVFPSYSAHGVHVAGIVAGRDETKYVDEAHEQTFVGVAPEAQLVICKVFTDNPDSKMLGGADTVDILAALSDCVTIGVDVINMSLGSSAGFSDETSDKRVQAVYEKIEKAGISLVVAASNDYSSGYGGGNGTNLASNPDSGTVGSPSTYSAALSVASIEGQKSRYMKIGASDDDVAFITNASDANGNEYDFMQQLYDKTGTPLNEELTLKYVVVGGVGRLSDYNTSVRNELRGGQTIALVKRGDITFAEKVQYAMSNGALGCIIYNNLSGTIRMSLGDVLDPIPTCSITMDAGQLLLNNAASSGGRTGMVTFSNSYLAGPFMSEFSSWGPTPDLKLKPEITAHGGKIISAVPGGYDEYSGTSMASPNMAGAVTLLRQYIKNHPDKYGYSSDDLNKGKTLNSLVNQLLMSTAVFALNEEGNPYSPRKQGAGLGDISTAIHTNAFITTKDSDGKVMDKTKIELGDDPDKSGVYEMEFTVHNTSKDSDVTYTPKMYAMTETLATDRKTVAEKAYMLNSSNTDFYVGASKVTTITVPKDGGTVTVKAVLTLSAADRSYIETSFVNGMYVEGFIRLEEGNVDKTATPDIGLPFLAFYGDWTKAPLFDYDMWELAESQADPSVLPEDKLVSSAVDSKPLALYYDNTYIVPLGSYMYSMSPYDSEIYPTQEKSAISMYDEPSNRTLYELYMVYAGLLRGAKTMDVVITDKVTGEVVYEKTEENVRKAYSGGGSGRGSAVMLRINPTFYGWSNNTTYSVSLKGTLDYDGKYAQEPDRNTFDFDFTVDTEAPMMSGYRIRYVPYTENRVTKYRIYLDVDVVDNQYVMDVMPCYIKTDRDGTNTLSLLTRYPVPVYGQKGETSTISLEITDYYDSYVRTGELYIAVEDYAMNQSIFVITDVDGSALYPDTVSLKTDNKLTFKQSVTENTGTYNEYEIVMQPNENYKVTINALPDAATAGALIWKTSNANVLAQNRELFAVNTGRTDVTLVDGKGAVKAKISVRVAGTPLSEPVPNRIKLEPVLNGRDYLQNIDEGDLTLNPNQTVKIIPHLEPWYCNEMMFTFSSSKPDVFTVDKSGNLTTHAKGSGTLIVKVKDPAFDWLEKRVTVEVGSEYNVVNYTLHDYYGGPEVVIPEHLNVMYLDEDCFRYNKDIVSVVLPSTLLEIHENAFENCTSLRSVTIKDKCTFIGNNAFRGCTALETIILEEFKDKLTPDYTDTGTITAGKSAFAGCTSLKYIGGTDATHEKGNPTRLNTAFDHAFAGCTSLEEVDISGLRVAYESVFEGCTSLKTVKTGSFTYIGPYMFKDCTSLESINVSSGRIGDGAFSGCTSLKSVTFNADEKGKLESFTYFGEKAFENCEKLGAENGITLPDGTFRVGENAFKNCTSLTKVTLSASSRLVRSAATPFAGCTALTAFDISGSNPYYEVDGGILYNKGKSVIELVPLGATQVTLPVTVTSIGDNAFASSKLESITVTGVTSVGAYAFAGSALKSIDFTAGLTSLGEGAFAGCDNLTTVNGLAGIKSLAARVFYNCPSLTTTDLQNLVSVGDYAFANTGLTTLPIGEDIKNIGAHAFENTKIAKLNLNGTDITLGDYAFARNALLTEAIINGVTAKEIDGVMTTGDYAFAVCPLLTKVTIGANTNIIGNAAFANIVYSQSLKQEVFAENSALKELEVSSSVRWVGDYAFYQATALVGKNGGVLLDGVEFIGRYAFFGAASLSGVKIPSVKEVGDLAFYGCKNLASLGPASLSNAEIIGAYAFASTAIKELSIPKIQRLGSYAFTGTAITSLTIPETLPYSYEETWWDYDDGGNLEEIKGKQSPSYGAGAFANISTLTRIDVDAGNANYVSFDGVLYAKTARGLVLLQYPAGKSGTTFTIPTGTVRIGDAAFEGAAMLGKVTFPYTVEAIGSYAFFLCNIRDYIFEGVEAPILEAAYDADLVEYFYEMVRQRYPNMTYLTECYYSNFNTYMMFGFAEGSEPILHYPENGKGYDGFAWVGNGSDGVLLSISGFFSKESQRKTTGYAATRLTHRVIEAIDAIPSVDEIKRANLEGVKQISEDYVQVARALYNQVTESGQLALITNASKLTEAEKAVRDRRSALKDPAKLTSLVMVTGPTKIRYTSGEKFSAAGMVIKAVYDDNSEIILSSKDYKVDKSKLYYGDEYVTITYKGLKCIVYVNVDEGTGSEKKGCGGSIAGLALAGAAVAAVASFVCLKKRKKDE